MKYFRRRKWQPTPVSLPGKSHGQRSLVGYRPWGSKESDTTEQLHYYHKPSLSFIKVKGTLRAEVGKVGDFAYDIF